MIGNFVTFVFLTLSLLELNSANNLKLVTVLFRHGDRTPDIGTLYPLDPYFNESYYPVGIGQLTNKGKQRLFKFGQLLRERYDLFLGDTYFPGLLEAVSTNMDRTKASLQLVLAGLFPPKGKHSEWNPLLSWQPIPYNYTLTERDLWMTYDLKKYCPKYAKLYDEYLKSPPGEDFLKRNSALYEYLGVNTGLNLTEIIKIWGIYSILLSQVEWGLKIPQWTETVFPDVLEKLTVEIVRIQVATTELKQLSGGPMLKKIIKNMIAKIDNKLIPKSKKLILYSAHDINIAYLSGVFDQNIDHPVPYGSYYIIELIEINGVDNVQIYTNDYVNQNLTAVQIPGCSITCPLKEFAKLLEKYIPDDNACWSN